MSNLKRKSNKWICKIISSGSKRICSAAMVQVRLTQLLWQLHQVQTCQNCINMIQRLHNLAMSANKRDWRVIGEQIQIKHSQCQIKQRVRTANKSRIQQENTNKLCHSMMKRRSWKTWLTCLRHSASLKDKWRSSGDKKKLWRSLRNHLKGIKKIQTKLIFQSKFRLRVVALQLMRGYYKWLSNIKPRRR